MLSTWLSMLITLGATFVLNLVLTPLILAVARKKQWVAKTNQRTVHKEPTPRLGGVGIVFSFALVVGGLVFLNPWIGFNLPPIIHSQAVLLLALGLAATHLVGLMDDFIEFRAIYKGTLQLGGALLAIGSGVIVTHIAVPFTDIIIPLGPFGPFLTLIWILGVTNAVNLIDGMDGLAGGLVAITLAYIGIWGLFTGHIFQAVACSAGLGAILAFLVFNLPPAKIFMGDSGSLPLGFLVAILSVWGGEYSLFHQFWLLPFTLVLIPIGDTLSAVLRRLMANRPVWAPDKEHTHHKLMALGFRPWQILALAWSGTFLTSLPVLVASLAAPHTDELVIWSCLGSVASVIAAFTVLHIRYRQRFPLVIAPPDPPHRLS